MTVPGWLPLTGLSWLPFVLACSSPTNSKLIYSGDEFKTGISRAVGVLFFRKISFFGGDIGNIVHFLSPYNLYTFFEKI